MVGPPGHQPLKILMRWRPGARVSVPPCGVGRHMLDTRASVSVDSRRGPTLSVRHHFADGKMKAQCSELLTRGLSPPNLCTPTQREMLGVVPQEVLEVLAPLDTQSACSPQSRFASCSEGLAVWGRGQGRWEAAKGQRAPTLT